MISLTKTIGFNVIAQTCARAISLIVCLYFFKEIDKGVLGLVNVRLMLLYDTILFLTREPIRKANIADSSISQFVNVVWLSPIVCFAISLVCISLWTIASDCSVPLWILLCFPCSSMIESFAEPFVVYSIRFSIVNHFAVSQALLVILKRLVAFGLITLTETNAYHLDILAISQILASLLYLFFNVSKFYYYTKQNLPELAQFQSFRSFFPTPKDGLNGEFCSRIINEYPKVLSHFLISNGSNFVMTFTNFVSLEEIGLYDVVERLGGFFCRILFAPLEDICYGWTQKKEGIISKNLSQMLPAIIRLSIYFGVVAASRLDFTTHESLILSFYSLFIATTVVSTTLDYATKYSTANKNPNFNMMIIIIHVALNVILCYKFHAAGFILANSANMIIRICYSWRHISNYLGQSTPSIFDDILPKSDVFIFLFFSFFATMFSFVIFGTAEGLSHLLAHVAVGLVMILLLGYHIYHTDHAVKAIFNEKAD